MAGRDGCAVSFDGHYGPIDFETKKLQVKTCEKKLRDDPEKRIFFDKSVILKTTLAQMFIKTMDLNVDENLVITIKDYGPGIPDSIKNRLFKEMITTKGKDGTGLGLFMSYSMIKAKFNGDIKFETSSEGTEFNIILPL